MTTTPGSEQVRELIRDLSLVPKTLRLGLRHELRAAAEPIVADARGRAAWSTRIPPAIKIRVRFALRNPGVDVAVARTKAPHGRPYEGVTGTSTFRHPVHGHDRWVTQRTRPFLFPAARANRGKVLDAVGRSVDDSARRHGWRS